MMIEPCTWKLMLTSLRPMPLKPKDAAVHRLCTRLQSRLSGLCSSFHFTRRAYSGGFRFLLEEDDVHDILLNEAETTIQIEAWKRTKELER